MIRMGKAIGAVALGGAIALVGAVPVYAVSAPGLTVRAGTAVLTPAAGGGYAGELAVRLRAGAADVNGVSVTIVQPAGVRFAGERDGQLHTCVPDPAVGPRALECVLPVTIAAGTEHTINVKFTSLAEPQRRTRFSEPASVSASTGTSAEATARYRALLAGTGAGVAPGVYRPAATPDLAVTAGPTAFVDNGDGSWTGRTTVTVAAATDAEHDEIGLAVGGLPANSGVRVEGEPIGCIDASWPCRVDPVAKGARRTVTLVIWTPQRPDAGTTLTIDVAAMLAMRPLSDGNPADNTTTSTVSVN